MIRYYVSRDSLLVSFKRFSNIYLLLVILVCEEISTSKYLWRQVYW